MQKRLRRGALDAPKGESEKADAPLCTIEKAEMDEEDDEEG